MRLTVYIAYIVTFIDDCELRSRVHTQMFKTKAAANEWIASHLYDFFLTENAFSKEDLLENGFDLADFEYDAKYDFYSFGNAKKDNFDFMSKISAAFSPGKCVPSRIVHECVEKMIHKRIKLL